MKRIIICLFFGVISFFFQTSSYAAESGTSQSGSGVQDDVKWMVSATFSATYNDRIFIISFADNKLLLDITDKQHEEFTRLLLLDPRITWIRGSGFAYPFRIEGNKLYASDFGVLSIDKTNKRLIHEDGVIYHFEEPPKHLLGIDFGYIDVNLDEEEIIEEAVPLPLIEQKPTFQGGGLDKFLTWVQQNLIYPEEAKNNGIQGSVYLNITIGPDGLVSKASVLRSSNSIFEQESRRVVLSSPKWNPGYHRGNAVAVSCTVPVVFNLQ